MIDEAKLAAWEELAAKATPGPWRCDGFDCERGQVKLLMGCGESPNHWQWGAWTSLRTKENGNFVSASRTALPELITAYRELAAEREKAPRWHDRPTGSGLWYTPGGTLRLQEFTESHLREFPRMFEHWHCGRVFGPLPADTEAGT